MQAYLKGELTRSSGALTLCLTRCQATDHVKVCRFRDSRLSKIGNAPNDPTPQALNCQKYNVYTEYSPPNLTLRLSRSMTNRFSRYKVVENRKCIE